MTDMAHDPGELDLAEQIARIDRELAHIHELRASEGWLRSQTRWTHIVAAMTAGGALVAATAALMALLLGAR